jgi:carboxymethylenebutenolidase
MRIDLPSGTPAELVLPGDGQAQRALVIAPDVMGLRPLFDELAARLSAEHGWAVVAVEPFPGPELQTMPLEERLTHRIDTERLTTDLQLGADVVQERSGASRAAVLGFCMGGMNVFRAAGTGRFDKGVAFYGMIRPPEPWSAVGAGGDDPLDALARPECCPVLAILGGADHFTPPEDIAALERVGAHVTTQVYPDAGHGFVHDPSRPAHRADDAADAWRRVLDFLA